jgi:thiamine-phosphate pyrophosphorylase
MPSFLPKIYPLTDIRLTNLTHAEQCRRLLEGGADFIQIREKHASSGDFLTEAEAARQMARNKNARIIINDRVDIALILKADGVHLGQNDLPPEKARKILGRDALIGLSTHSVGQALEAIKLPVDYIAVGPVFQTPTKENPDEVVGLEGVRQVRAAIGSFPLVAIGGIGFGNYRDVLAAGADSVAVISGLLSDPARIADSYKRFAAALNPKTENC